MEFYANDNVCKDAINDESVFNVFKRIPEFTYILEHVSFEQGIEYINEIKKYNYLKYDWNQFLLNDTLGNPKVFDYYEYLKEIKLNTYFISATTLRYICFGLKILDYIISTGNSELDIIEVGGGYGGQCKILFDICNANNIKIKTYTIIDLENVVKLQKKYLDILHIPVLTVPFNQDCISIIKDKYDLFISNYALGEFEKNTQSFYIENILPRCENFYITWNSFPIDKYFVSANISEEVPQTNPTTFKNVVLTN